MTYNFRAREEARRREREAFERRDRRMFWTSLIIPAVACAITALAIGPDSWLGRAAVLAIAPSATAGVAIKFMIQSRKEPTP